MKPYDHGERFAAGALILIALIVGGALLFGLWEAIGYVINHDWIKVWLAALIGIILSVYLLGVISEQIESRFHKPTPSFPTGALSKMPMNTPPIEIVDTSWIARSHVNGHHVRTPNAHCPLCAEPKDALAAWDAKYVRGEQDEETL